MTERPLHNSLILLLLSVILILPWLGSADFSTRGEPREALVSQAMLFTGNWILPLSYNDNVPSKPPLMHWLTGIASLTTGEVSEFTARLPSALSFLVFILLFERFVRGRLGSSQSMISALILLTSVEWFKGAMACRVDMLLSTTLAGGLLCLFRWSERELHGIPFDAIFLLGLATLTKGPVSIVLPGGIFIAWLLFQRKPLSKIVFKSLLVFIPVGLIASSWYAAAYLTEGDRFLEKVYYENVSRFSGTMEDRPHAHSIFYLYGTLLLGFMPWTLIGLLSLHWPRRIWDSLKTYWGSAKPIEQFSAIAALAIVIFFSIPSSKRGEYLMPAYPFISLFLARIISSLDESRTKWAWRIQYLLSVSALLIFTTLLLVFSGAVDLRAVLQKDRLHSDLEWFLSVFNDFSVGLNLGTVMILCPIIVATWFLFSRNIERRRGTKPLDASLLSAFLVLVSIYLSLNSYVFPKLANALSPREFSEVASPIIQKEERVYSYLDEFYGVSFYTKKRFYSLDPKAPPRGVVVLFERNLPKLQEILSAGQTIEILASSKGSITKPNDHVVLVRIM